MTPQPFYTWTAAAEHATQSPTAKHITNALTALHDLITGPDDVPVYDYIHLELVLAIDKLSKEQTR